MINATQPSFAVVPKNIEENWHNQTLALPFRLMTVERVQKLKWFLRTRIDAMRNRNAMICSFLQEGEETYQALKKIGAEPVKYDKDGRYVEYATQTPENVTKMLRSWGAVDQDARSTYRTVFTKAGVEALFSGEKRAQLVHTIPDILTRTDDGSPINILGAIVRT